MAVFDESAEHPLVIHDRGYAPAEGTDEHGNRGLRLYEGASEAPELEKGQPLERECRDFLGAVRGGGPPRSEGRSALATIRVLEALEASLAAGGSLVSLPAARTGLPASAGGQAGHRTRSSSEKEKQEAAA
jgi:predicted dehydrogenase